MNGRLSALPGAPRGLRACRICGAPGAAPALVLPDVPIHLWPVDGPPPHEAIDLEWHVCPSCDHLQLQSMAPALVNRFYEQGVFVETTVSTHRDRLDAYRSALGDGRTIGARALDVGGGSNPFVGLLDEARERWVSDVVVSDAARGVATHVRAGDFLEQDLPERFFDLITAFHVLEHFCEPDLVIATIERALGEDGHVLVEVPDADPYTVALPHYALFPAHQSYYRPHLLDGLFARHGLARVATFERDLVVLAAYGRDRAGGAPAPHGRPATEIVASRERLVAGLDERLRDRIGTSRRVAVYGAGGSTTMLLACLPWLRERVTEAFDRDPQKQTRWIPGTAARVGDPEAAAASDADLVLFLSSAAHAEMAPRLRGAALDVGAIFQALSAEERARSTVHDGSTAHA